MGFYDVLDQVLALLRQRGRVTYRVLKREFNLDDEALEDLKEELLFAHPVVDQDGRGLVWTGESGRPELTSPATQPTQPALTHEVQSTQVERPTTDPHIPDAERRQLTVLFTDLVESTALSGQLDAEDYREVVRAYQATCAEAVQRFDCYLAQTLGDGLLIYSGYPVAHENDAERAVRVGLGIIENMKALNQRLEQDKDLRLAIRVGIHTGPVVVGEVGTGARHEQLALGEVPNIAARIQGLAEPDTVIISDATYRLVQGYFDCDIWGERVLRGVADPIVVYRVRNESGAQSWLDIASARGLTPLVGREQETRLLIERWAQVKEKQGQVIRLSGEAGIGKSRLVQVLKAHVKDEAHMWLECRSSPYYQNTALYPMTDFLKRFFNWMQADTPDEKLTKLEQALSQYRLPLEESVQLFAPLVSVVVPEDRYPPLTLTPQRQRQKTLEAIVTILLELTEHQPVLFVLEDMHWTDPMTLEFVDLLINQAPTASIYILLTCRLEFQPPWRHRSYLTEVTIHRLSPNQITRMAEQVAGGKELPDAIAQQLVAKTDGVPLYVEEMTKALLELGHLKEVNGRYALTGSVASLSVPATLQDSLMARLDRLVTAKAVAQYASVIGRQFSYDLLQAVSQLDETMLQHELRRLVEAELLYQRGLPPQATYTFKHALIQDTAYASLLRRTRQGYHRRIAEVLEERFPEAAETQPELLAHHYTEAGLLKQAVAYGHRAGEEALKRFAFAEAVTYLTTALERLASLPDTPERARQELHLQLTLANVLATLKGYAAPEAKRAYVRARQLCEQIGETSLPYLTVLRGLSRAYYTGGDLQQAREVAEELLRLAQEQDDPAPLPSAHVGLGIILYLRGEFYQARQHFEQSLVLHERIPQHQLALFSAQRRTNLGVLAQTLWMLGYPDQALESSKTSLLRTRDASVDTGLANALNFAGMIHLFRREARSAWEINEETIVLTTEHGLALQRARGIMQQGIALSRQGQHDAGLAQIEEGMTAFRNTGSGGALTIFLGWLAEAYERTERFEEAQATLTEALGWRNKWGEGVFEAELYRLKGEILLQQTTRDEQQAETCFQQALDIARQQQAKSWELRAATSLACLWRSHGKRQDAYGLLAPIYEWFTEGLVVSLNCRDEHE